MHPHFPSPNFPDVQPLTEFRPHKKNWGDRIYGLIWRLRVSKNYASQRRDRILRFLSRPGNRAISKLHRNLENKENNPLENIPKVQWSTPKLQISVPCHGRMWPEFQNSFFGGRGRARIREGWQNWKWLSLHWDRPHARRAQGN